MNEAKKEKRLANAKRWAIGAGIVTYITAASLAVLYGSAALYQVFHKQKPHDLSIGMSFDNLRETADDPKEHKKVLISIGFPAGLLFLVAPMLMLGLGGSRRELFGSARFASRPEITKSGLLGGKGIILGKYPGRFLMLAGSLSVMLSAPTRSGKGVSVVVPNCLNWPDSLVVLDVKPELARITAGFRAKHGQKVYVWAPFAEDGRTHGYNPLAYIRTGYRFVVGDALAIAQIIYPTPTNASGSSVFFAETARNLFLGLTLYLVETPELPRTIGEVLRQASGNGNPVKAYLQGLIDERTKSDRPLSDKCVNALMRFLNTSDDVLTSILSTVNAPLLVFEDALVDAATSHNDFLLTNLRRERMTVYVQVPIPRLADAAVLLNLFYAQLLNLNTDELPEHNPALKYQVLMINDEFTTMGRVNAFSRGIGYIAGFGLRCLTVVQSRAQIDSTYGKDDSRNFVTNHGAELMFAPKDQRDANEYSEALGHFTDKSESKGRSSSGKSGSSQSSNTSVAKRPLLYPQEFKEIGVHKSVLMVENVRPIMADKICYYTDPVFMQRLMAPPAIPLIDLELHRARVERRVRASLPGELFTIDQIAMDFSSLPDLNAGATPEEMAAFVCAVLNQMRAERPAEAHADSQEPAPSTSQENTLSEEQA
jgi:type IV secretion system protein VirD4